MKRAVRLGGASARDLAYLEDRVRVRSGRRQIYGTQFGPICGGNQPYPIEDEQHVDERRKVVGLEPMRTYEQKIGKPCRRRVDEN